MRNSTHSTGRNAVAGLCLISLLAAACSARGIHAGGDPAFWFDTPATATLALATALAVMHLFSTAAYTLLIRPFREHDLEGYYHALFSTPDRR